MRLNSKPLRAGLVLLLAALLTVALRLPVLVRSAVREGLQRLDPQATFEISQVALRRIELAGVALGDPPWLTAERVEVTYHPLDAALGRVQSVVIHGATLTLRQLAPGRPGASAPALDLPLERLDLRDGTVVLDTPGVQLRLALTGSFQRREGLESAMITMKVQDGIGHLGKLPIRDAQAAFTLDASGTLLVEQARWTMGETARLSMADFRVSTRDPVISTTLAAEDLSLGYWLPLLTEGRADGAGLLAGRVPITWRPGATRPLELGEGSLSAAPSGGWITVDDVNQLGALLESSDPRMRTDPNMQLVKERLVEALADFHYDALRLELVREPDGLLLRALTSGRGRRGAAPQEIGGLTINIHDIDTVLSDLLLLKGPSHD